MLAKREPGLGLRGNSVKITICNGKGGAGKTTISMMLALAFSEAGRRVGISDRDPQGTATLWLERLESVKKPEIAAPGVPYDILIIDTPPNLAAPQVKDAIREADKIILVASPSPADRWTTEASAKLIQSYLIKKQRARLLFNQVQTGTLLAQELDGQAEAIGMPALFNILRRRQCYQHAASSLGWSALTQRAKEEVLMVASDIQSL